MLLSGVGSKLSRHIFSQLTIITDILYGWLQRQQLNIEIGNREYSSLLETVYTHDGLGDVPAARYFALLNRFSRELEHLTLDLMPIFCGDLNLEHNSETMLARGRTMPGDLISSKRDAPILRELATMFPLVSFG